MQAMTDLAVLDRVIYTEAEAALILTMPPSTLHYWLEGKAYRGKTYAPVIRHEPTGLKDVTWAEFIEAGLLRQYRKADIPLPELRFFILSLREKFDTPYPLAHARPLTLGKSLVMEAQSETNCLPSSGW